MKRRSVIKAGLVLIGTATAASILRPVGAAAKVFAGGTRWQSEEASLPTPAVTDRLLYLTEKEVEQVKAIFDRLIPADEFTPSASDVGCVTFLDNQLAGPYGKGEWLYKGGPIQSGTPQQGEQSAPLAPADLYRKALVEIDEDCLKSYGKVFAALTAEEKDAYLEAMEEGRVKLQTLSSARVFGQFLSNAMEGFLADPIYGGNRDMVGWKMIGFPGSRYDYRDVVHLKGQKLDIEPVSLVGRI